LTQNWEIERRDTLFSRRSAQKGTSRGGGSGSYLHHRSQRKNQIRRSRLILIPGGDSDGDQRCEKKVPTREQGDILMRICFLRNDHRGGSKGWFSESIDTKSNSTNLDRTTIKKYRCRYTAKMGGGSYWEAPERGLRDFPWGRGRKSCTLLCGQDETTSSTGHGGVVVRETVGLQWRISDGKPKDEKSTKREEGGGDISAGV